MHYNLFNYISDKTGMSQQEFDEEILPYCKPVFYQKKEYLLQKGEICNFIVFIVEGLTRTFRIGDNDQQQISTFGFENYWITNRESYVTGEPALKFIQALEPTKGLYFEKVDFEKIMKDNVLFRNMTAEIKDKNTIVTYNKVASLREDSAEEKYHKFLTSFPEITQRVPQHMIASYLGLKPETLSRLRKKPIKK